MCNSIPRKYPGSQVLSCKKSCEIGLMWNWKHFFTLEKFWNPLDYDPVVYLILRVHQQNYCYWAVCIQKRFLSRCFASRRRLGIVYDKQKNILNEMHNCMNNLPFCSWSICPKILCLSLPFKTIPWLSHAKLQFKLRITWVLKLTYNQQKKIHPFLHYYYLNEVGYLTLKMLPYS